MFIQSLRLHDFRSYHQVLLTPPAGVTVFVGENGAGKTNLLEPFTCAAWGAATARPSTGR